MADAIEELIRQTESAIHRGQLDIAQRHLAQASEFLGTDGKPVRLAHCLWLAGVVSLLRADIDGFERTSQAAAQALELVATDGGQGILYLRERLLARFVRAREIRGNGHAGLMRLIGDESHDFVELMIDLPELMALAGPSQLAGFFAQTGLDEVEQGAVLAVLRISLNARPVSSASVAALMFHGYTAALEFLIMNSPALSRVLSVAGGMIELQPAARHLLGS